MGAYLSHFLLRIRCIMLILAELKLEFSIRFIIQSIE